MKTRRALGSQSLLILHLDAEKLREDRLHLGDIAAFSGTLSSLALGSEALVADATSLDGLHRLLASLVTARRRFDVVVVIAHSNADGIRIASDKFVRWDVFAEYLKPLGPRRLLLVACRGGRWDAGEALFNANRDLRRIFACPVIASKGFGAMMLFAVPYVVATRAPKDDHVLLGQVALIAATGGQLREWRLTTDKGMPDSSVFDLLADLADPIARQIPSALRAIFGGS